MGKIYNNLTDLIGKMIVVDLPDTGKRYLTNVLFLEQ